MAYVHLSLNDLPTFDTTSLFCTLRTETEKHLRHFPNAFERARAGLRFTQYIGGGFPFSADEELPMQAAFLRAALMEFVGMEEVLPNDLQSSEKPLKIRNTENSLLVLLREFRNLHLHVINSSLRQETREAVSYSYNRVAHQATFGIQIIPPADLALVKTLRNAAQFDPGELDAAIAWFDNAQRAWGIADVVKLGFEVYAQLIIKRHLDQ